MNIVYSLIRLIIDCDTERGTTGECSEAHGLPVLVTDPEEKCRRYESGDCQPQFDTSEYTSIVSEVSIMMFLMSYRQC